MFTRTNRSRTLLTKGSFTREKWNELSILFGIIFGLFHRSLFSVVDTSLLPSAQEMAKKSRESIDDVSNVRGAWSKANPISWKSSFRDCSCATTSENLTIDRSSRKLSDVPSQEIQARHRVTDCIFWVPSGIQGAQKRSRQDRQGIIGCQKEQQSALSSAVSSRSQIPGVCGPGERLRFVQEEEVDIQHLLTPGVTLDPSLLDRMKHMVKKTLGNFELTS